MIKVGTSVIWDEKGYKQIKGRVEMVMNNWFAVQWENGRYTRYNLSDINSMESFKLDLERIREEKLKELGI